jgi:two-component system, sensor histidine kinase and response regulator
MKGDRERCLAAGMDGYASKPLQPRELFEVIDNVAAAGDPGGAEGPGPSATGPAFNEAEALGRTGGDQELLRELMGVFLGEYPGWLAEIRNAIAQNDAATLKRAAHSVKGAVGHFGARAAGDAAQRLETMGRDANLAGASAACATLEQELNRLQSALADFVAQPSS